MALIELGAGSGVFYETSTVGSGTGNYNSFLRLQNKPEEQGFNTDDSNEADNKDGVWTHAMLVGSLVEVDIGGVLYYEIRLDLNEGNAEGDPPITLEDLQLFYSTAPADGDDFDNGFVDLTQVFDLSGSLALTDINSGSGTDDYRFLIRADLFPDKNAYFTLYSAFSGSDGGFEEWRALSQDVGDGLPVIHIEKDVVPTSINEGTPTDVLYTYTLTNLSPGDDALLLTSFIDDFATPGNPLDDIDLLTGASGTDLGDYYVSGDADGDGLLDKTETWIFQAPRTGVVLDATEEMTNVAAVNAIDEEGNNTTDSDDATITAVDVLPAINIEKIASPTQIQAGVLSPVTFTYSITNTSTTTLDPLTLTELVDDNGTLLNLADDVDLLTGAIGTDLGDYYVSGDDGDALLETGETWIFEYTTDVTLLPGESRTNIVSVTGEDDEGNSVGDTDDAIVTAFNLGRTPGFWSNNGSLLWDGNTGTFPKAGGLGIVGAGEDLAYAIHDLNGDGVVDNVVGSTQYLMVGDWNTNGIADANENVLVISRSNALSLLNASEKQQQDGRFVLSRDMIASWLNYLGGSYVGDSDDPNSAMHYIDEATAWLIETTSDHNHVLRVDELTAGTKVAQSSSAWQNGFDYDGDAVKGENMVPAAGQHDIGLGTTLDILGGSTIHTGLDHYNNNGFI